MTLRPCRPLGFMLMLTMVAASVVLASGVASADETPRERANAAIAAAGGEEKLLKLFRMTERILIVDKPAAPVAPNERPNRTSIIETGGGWWLAGKPRNKEKVRVLCYAWSLRILLDPQAELSLLDGQDAGQPVRGLRVRGVVAEPVDLWFDPTTLRLVAIDYIDSRHRFSEWKQTPGGLNYPGHVTGHRFVNREKGTTRDEQWYQTDLLEITPLESLPPEVQR